MSSRIASASALVLAIFTLIAVEAQAPRQFRARLSVVPIDVTMQATIAGSGTVTATLNGATLTLTGTFKDLKTAATVARVHRGPNKGMRGPAIADLTITKATSGEISG